MSAPRLTSCSRSAPRRFPHALLPRRAGDLPPRRCVAALDAERLTHGEVLTYAHAAPPRGHRPGPRREAGRLRRGGRRARPSTVGLRRRRQPDEGAAGLRAGPGRRPSSRSASGATRRASTSRREPAARRAAAADILARGDPGWSSRRCRSQDRCAGGTAICASCARSTGSSGAARRARSRIRPSRAITAGRPLARAPLPAPGEVRRPRPRRVPREARAARGRGRPLTAGGLIVEQAEAAGRDVGGLAVDDEELLDTLTNLVEWPVAVCGAFDPAYLDRPGGDPRHGDARAPEDTSPSRTPRAICSRAFIAIANIRRPRTGADRAPATSAC